MFYRDDKHISGLVALAFPFIVVLYTASGPLSQFVLWISRTPPMVLPGSRDAITGWSCGNTGLVRHTAVSVFRKAAMARPGVIFLQSIVHVPEVVTGLLGASLIGILLWASIHWK